MHLSAENKTERERSYVLNNTVYLIAQYFAWTEIIRRDMEDSPGKLQRIFDPRGRNRI